MHEGWQCAPAMRAGLYALRLPSLGLGPSGNDPFCNPTCDVKPLLGT
jgi:hypothetical protein